MFCIKCSWKQSRINWSYQLVPDAPGKRRERAVPTSGVVEESVAVSPQCRLAAQHVCENDRPSDNSQQDQSEGVQPVPARILHNLRIVSCIGTDISLHLIF